MNPKSLPPDMRLVSEPGQWVIEMKGDGRMYVVAHGYSMEDGEFVFSMLMEGRPPFEVEVVRLPQAIVESLSGG